MNLRNVIYYSAATIPICIVFLMKAHFIVDNNMCFWSFAGSRNFLAHPVSLTVGFFFFQRFTCNTVGGPWWVLSLFRSVAGQLFLQYFDAVGWVF